MIDDITPPDEDPGDMWPYSGGTDPADGMPWEQ